MVKTFIDFEDGKIVSSLVFYAIKLPHRYKGVIEAVKTDEGYRNQGRATKLLKQAIKLAQKLKVDCIELTVRFDNPNAKRLYEKIGFKGRENESMRLNICYEENQSRIRE